ncbi:MAG: 2Fe-2S iron-sulfur cluster-binding protein [Chloroflexus sp.]|uniref:2Fe-2S iron-sulfur cluster-binding protein n=1 Tax=Chloroflexus sp. TaxID=1904827 RepID=UPI00404AB76A
MPKITIGNRSVDVAAGTRLVLAIEQAGIAIGHRCGGYARCTTCRVAFAEGEPEEMTAAEYAKLSERGLLGQYRLSCQIVCNHDMEIADVPMTLESQGWTDTGPAPEPTVTPDPTTLPRATLAAQSS